MRNKVIVAATARRRHSLAIALAVALAFFAASCGGGGSKPAPQPSEIRAVVSGAATARIAAGAGSADAGTTVSIVAGGTGTGTAAADGSFLLNATATGASGAVLTVHYTKSGTALSTDVTLTTQGASVNTALFATGSAPNDIVLVGGGVYVANSLDNTVVRYNPTTGASEQSHSFAVGVSPSYLSTSGNSVWVSANGDNTVTGLKVSDLTPLVGASFQLSGTAAFIGPMEPLAVGTTLYVPRNEIATFGPTTYGTGLVSAIDITSGGGTDISTLGKNPQCCAFDNTLGILYVVTAGDIQFDASFHPNAVTDSFVEAYDTGNNNLRVGSINLGKVAAGRIALSRNGQTAYLGNALTGDVFKVDLAAGTVLRGAANPIHLTSTFTYTSDVQFTQDYKYLLATSFNTDELYVIDPATDTLNPGPYPAPFSLKSGSSLGGALRMAVGPDPISSNSHPRVYVVMGVANAVASVDL